MNSIAQEGAKDNSPIQDLENNLKAEDLVLITIGKKSRYLKRNGPDDVWVTASDIEYLCGAKRRVVRDHIQKLKEENKIAEKDSMQFYCTPGKSTSKQWVPHYSFENVAIEVAFRMKSKDADVFVAEVKKTYTKTKVHGIYAEPDRLEKQDPKTIDKLNEYVRKVRLAQIESGKFSNEMLKLINPDYQKVLKDQNSQFYRMKEARFNYAATGKHGVYIRDERFDVLKVNMGLHPSKKPTRTSIKVARNFFFDSEYTNLIELDDGLEFVLKRAVRRGHEINHERLDELIYEAIILVGFPYTEEAPKLDSDRLYAKHLKLYDDYISQGHKIVLL